MLRLNSIYIYDTILDLSSNSDVSGTSVRTMEYVTWLPTAATFFPNTKTCIYNLHSREDQPIDRVRYGGYARHNIIYTHTHQVAHKGHVQEIECLPRPYGMQKRHTAWCVSHDAFFLRLRRYVRRFLKRTRIPCDGYWRRRLLRPRLPRL